MAFSVNMGMIPVHLQPPIRTHACDAVITGKFRRANMCTRIEGERLLAFTNTGTLCCRCKPAVAVSAI